MNTNFKSALNQIKADEALVKKAEMNLQNSLSNNKKAKLINLFKTRAASKFFIAAASFLVIIIGGSSAAYAYYQTPVAYLSLDINPSVELGVNAFGKVVTAEGCNEDGQAILADTDVTGSTVEDAVQCLILSADCKGYIAADGSCVISLTSETNNTDKAINIQTKSELGVNQALIELEKLAVVQKDNVAIECRDEAKQLGITPGKLNLINKLQVVDPTATIDDYKDASVKEIMECIKLNSNNGELNSDNDKSDNDKFGNDKYDNDKSDFDKSEDAYTKEATENCTNKYNEDEMQKSNDYKSDNENETKCDVNSEIYNKNTSDDSNRDSDKNSDRDSDRDFNIDDRNNEDSNTKTSSEWNNNDSENNFSTNKFNTSVSPKGSVDNSRSNDSNHR